MFEQAFRKSDDILRKEAGCGTELDYAEQTSWLLFANPPFGGKERAEVLANIRGLL